MGTSDESAADRALWHAAQSVLSGTPDAEALRRLRRQKVVRVWVCFALGVLPLVVVAVTLLTHGHHPAHHHPEPNLPAWRSALSWTLTSFGVALVILCFVQMKRTKVLGSAWTAPQQVLNRQQRKHLIRQVQGSTPVDPRTLPLARDLALRRTRVAALLPLFAGEACLLVDQLVLRFSAAQLAFVAAMCALGVVTYVVAVRQLRRARLFLATYPPAPPLPTASAQED